MTNKPTELDRLKQKIVQQDAIIKALCRATFGQPYAMPDVSPNSSVVETLEQITAMRKQRR
jgi:hypothetical protein